MTSAISWIPKGVFKSVPLVVDPPLKEDLQEFITRQSSEGKNKDEDETNGICDGIALAFKDLHMERYDDEDEGVELFSSGTNNLYYSSNDKDPYLKDNNDYDSEDDLEDMIINPTDSVIVCARSKNGVGQVEIWILDEDREENMYCHHEINIPAYPLCTAWLDCPLQGGERGNFLAVGSMEPQIEIWNLDVVAVDGEPERCVVLGDTDDKEKNGEEKSTKCGHSDSVLDLAWNKDYRNIIASASADKQVKIWDVVSEKCEITLKHHSDKVQAVAWNHHQRSVLISGSFDRTVVLKDLRMPSHTGYKGSVSAVVWSLASDPHSEHSFVVGLKDGNVNWFDIRTAKSDSTSGLNAAFTISAHDTGKPVTSVSYNLLAPNLLATGSEDKTVKLWDLSNNQPSCVATYYPRIETVHSISFSQDNPFWLAIGGKRNNFRVWDTLSDPTVSQRYGNYRR